ncbi:MAG: hypothetical protein Q8R26_01090 [bacterium]|nr:hypothetical protein [bacterium]
MREKFTLFLKQLQLLLLPHAHAIGLEISDSVLRLVQIDMEVLHRALVVLPLGVIEDGKIKDRAQLVERLVELHTRFMNDNAPRTIPFLATSRQKLQVIVTIPAANVYTQLFSVPMLEQANLEEAALLNLQSISPINFNASYSDWEKVSEHEQDFKYDVIGAFAQRAVVDEYVSALEEVGFEPIAVEFSALALTRTIKDAATDFDISKPHVVINVMSDGINFIVIKNGNLYFEYFTSWKLIQNDKREILFDDFRATIVREIKKVVTFYENRWATKLDQLLLVSEALIDEIAGFVQQDFNLPVVQLRLTKFSELSPAWFPVAGSALRGETARAHDRFISLLSVGTEQRYRDGSLMIFFRMWRNSILTTLGFLAIVFIIADSFIAGMESRSAQQLEEVAAVSSGSEIASLQSRVHIFNQLVNTVAVAKGESIAQSSFFSTLERLVGGQITLTRVALDVERSSVIMSGEAADESAAINFKNALIREGFRNVLMPLSSLKTNAQGKTVFSLTMELK